MALAPLSAGFQSLSPLPTITLGPCGAESQVGWCACFRPLWVSPMNSPVRSGVSPTATSTPMGVFSQRFVSFISLRWSPGLHSLPSSLLFFLVYLYANVGPWGLLAAAGPAPIHNPPPRCVRQPPPCLESCLLLLPVWMNVSCLSPWLSDFHTVRFFC